MNTDLPYDVDGQYPAGQESSQVPMSTLPEVSSLHIERYEQRDSRFSSHDDYSPHSSQYSALSGSRDSRSDSGGVRFEPRYSRRPQYTQPQNFAGNPASTAFPAPNQWTGNPLPYSYPPHHAPTQNVFQPTMNQNYVTAQSAQLQQFSSRSPRGAAQQPPHAMMSNEASAIYQVQFKVIFRHYVLGVYVPNNVMVGDIVIVEADRGEDIGVVTQIFNMKQYMEVRYAAPFTDNEDKNIGRILRVANSAERQLLPEKFHDERNVYELCKELAANTYMLPMMIIDAEYQYDRKKLTIYYESNQRVDFRDLVRDLFSSYKARIWMKQLRPNQFQPPPQFVMMSLATGVQFPPEP